MNCNKFKVFKRNKKRNVDILTYLTKTTKFRIHLPTYSAKSSIIS